ncbi:MULTISPECIES: DNA cytosine methyltransferase [unclassified Sinorhizobium]|uniref:DNA cytosine methyltransferase n=1 Tax=unclassified Sinorhizobium TaxID=2613772 RepID=UPI003526504B
MEHDNDNSPVGDNHTGLRFLSVCSGIEAASVAWHPLGWKAAAFAEIEPAPCSVLKHHYPTTPNLGDMTKFKEWPEYGKDGSKPIDIVCGGTPCQAFSVAGLREGLNDPRGNLSLTFLAIVDKYRPTWVLFENVPGILSSVTHVSPDPREPEIDLDSGDGPGDGEEVVVEDEYDADESHAFSCFLAGLSELGYGWSYVVRDAQYVRVDGFARAVPQRRRRVFVVGYLGDWRRAAAVLLEPESMSGNPAPSRQAGQKPAATISARAQGGGGPGSDFEPDGGLVSQPLLAKSNSSHDDSKETYVPVMTFDRQSSGEYGTDPIASTNSARDYKSPSDLIVSPDVASTLTRGSENTNGKGGYAGRRQEDDSNLVAHTLKGEGYDASEDGTGRGTPIVPVSVAIRGREDGGTIEMGDDVAHALRASQGGGDKPHVLAPIAFNPKLGGEPTYGLGVNIDGTSYTLDASGHSTAIAFAQNSRDEVRLQNGDGSISGALSAEPGMKQTTYVAHAIQAGALRENPNSGPDGVGVQADIAYTLEARAEVQAVQTEWSVRRLTPKECARLQGFPDDYLSQVIHNGKPLADGPMYKGLGNSWPVNVVRWIGRRIQMVEEIAAELEAERKAANDNTQQREAA